MFDKNILFWFILDTTKLSQNINIKKLTIVNIMIASDMNNEKYKLVSHLRKTIIEVMKEIYDPEIPINVYDLGLVYDMKILPEKKEIRLCVTMTSPMCPLAGYILDNFSEKIKEKLSENNHKDYTVNLDLVFEPLWNPNMMNPEVREEFGL